MKTNYVKQLVFPLVSCLFVGCASIPTQESAVITSDSLTSAKNSVNLTFKTKAVAPMPPAPSIKPSVAPSCPPPPPPPPIPQQVLDRIKKEMPSLLPILDSMKTMSPVDFTKKMADLAKQYPQYFKAPPPPPPAGVCAPPPAGAKTPVPPSIPPAPSTKPSVAPSCPPPPPPPPIPQQVLDRIKKEMPSLLPILDSMKTMSPVDFTKKMADLAKQYPQYFKAPPPPPPAGVCAPPPPLK